ncbi:MAG TPA: hypothetical protein PLM24_00740, partial [Methanothrix sp.]|nr:hypothetical protein [Methanothrix sp.]
MVAKLHYVYGIILFSIALVGSCQADDTNPTTDIELIVFLKDNNNLSLLDDVSRGEDVKLCYNIINCGEYETGEIKIKRPITPNIPKIFDYPKHKITLKKDGANSDVKETPAGYYEIFPICVYPPSNDTYYTIEIQNDGYLTFQCNNLYKYECISFMYDTAISKNASCGKDKKCSYIYPSSFEVDRAGQDDINIYPGFITIEPAAE